MKYLITSSLLDSYDWYKHAPRGWKNKAYQDFANMIRRVSKPTPSSAKRGIDFEDIVCKNCNVLSHEKLSELAENFYGSNKAVPIVCKMAEVCRGGEQQKKVFSDITVAGDDYHLFGYADIVFPDKILDIKTCAKYKGKANYENRSQHHVYFYCTNIYDFYYLIADFKGSDYPQEYKEISLHLDKNKSRTVLYEKIVETTSFIRDSGLWEDYASIFSGKHNK